MGIIGRCDPQEEFGFGASKKIRASHTKDTEEDEWEEDEVVDITDDIEEDVEAVDDGGILFDPSTRVSGGTCFLGNLFCNYVM